MGDRRRDEIRLRIASDPLPESIDLLAAAAAAEGIRNVGVLVADWRSRSQRFDGVGERLLLAVDPDGPDGADGWVVAVGGLTACPHVDRARRVRRFYVHPDHRRRGIARAMAVALLAHGFEHTGTITCNARASAAAPRFWESLGFHPVEIDGITHVLTR